MDRSESRPAGRPRDAHADDRIIDAALAEYAAHGRAGYSLNGVARRAGVGKSSIYLRWRDKEALLVDAVHARAAVPRVDTGTLRGDLEVLVTWLLDHFLTEPGWVAVRIAVDAATADVPLASPRDIGAQHRDALLAIWQRAAARGDVEAADGTDARAVTRMMYGDLLLSAMVDRDRLLAMSPEARADEAAHVVGLLLRLLRR